MENWLNDIQRYYKELESSKKVELKKTNSFEWCEQQAEDYNKKIEENGEKVYLAYIKKGVSEKEALNRKNIYIKNNFRSWTYYR